MKITIKDKKKRAEEEAQRPRSGRTSRAETSCAHWIWSIPLLEHVHVFTNPELSEYWIIHDFCGSSITYAWLNHQWWLTLISMLNDIPSGSITVLRPTIKGQTMGGGPIPRNPHSFPKIIRIILPLINPWNYTVPKN